VILSVVKSQLLQNLNVDIREQLLVNFKFLKIYLYLFFYLGIDAQTSSIVLGNIKCFGTENRSGHLTNGHMPGTILPIMQFANSDIEDLKIVDEEQAPEPSQQQSYQMSAVSSPPLPKQPSIHDDPAIVSAVVSSTNKDNTSNPSISDRLIHNLQHMKLSDEQSKNESRIHSNSGELGPSWSSSKWEQPNNNNNNLKASSQQHSSNKSKFFDDFISDKNNNTSNRSNQRSSNTHSTQTSRENGGQYDDNGLPIRQPFFSNDRPYPQRQQQQQYQQQYQQNRYQNENQKYQQRYNYNNRRSNMPNQQRRTGGGGNRETFQDNPNDYDADFDFEISNRKFNKLTSEDEFKNPTDLPSDPQVNNDSSTEHPPLYDKKRSFFDNLATTEPSDGSNYNRSNNKDTFGNDGYYRSNNRNGYRRSNNNYRQHNNNNNNGYHYRY
jgi:hypothetical protein